MASPAPATIPEELLVEIFLRLPTLADLARAAAACTSFRRLIKGRAFRSLHRPPLLGFMDAAGFHPAEAPHPSAPLAGALAPCAEDFSFVPPVASSASYVSSALSLPPDSPIWLVPAAEKLPRWRPRDARDGRVLLDWVSLDTRCVYMWGKHEDGSDVSVLMDCNELTGSGAGADAHRAWKKRERCNAADFHLAVCDPLSRRYELLPTIPEDFAAMPKERLFQFVPMLAPAAATDDESFKVICMARYQTKLALFVFLATPTTRQWRMAEFPILAPQGSLSCFDCVRGCFYWEGSDYLLVLDTRAMRFSYVHLLTGYHVQLRDLSHQSTSRRRPSAVVAGREGVIEMFSLVCQHGSFTLHHTSLQNDSHEWKLEKIIPLPAQYEDYSISTVGAAEGYLFFRGIPQGIDNGNVDCYSLEVKSYEITKVCSKKEPLFNPRHSVPYFSFPPLLSEPTIDQPV
ncbi:unnamed protein product [Alopecurus aequalis]